MVRRSAGLLVFRRRNVLTEFFLVHPGGPWWQGKDTGAWSIPKGEFSETEDALTAAIREFAEETGQAITGNFIPLAPVKQKGGKMVIAWAVEAEPDAAHIVSNTFKMEYPYKSGKWITVPEIDKAGWFRAAEARVKINPAQVQLIDELLTKLDEEGI